MTEITHVAKVNDLTAQHSPRTRRKKPYVSSNCEMQLAFQAGIGTVAPSSVSMSMVGTKRKAWRPPCKSVRNA